MKKIVFCIPVLALLLACGAGTEDQWIELFAEPELGAWRPERGDWFEAGESSIAPNDSGKLAGAPGLGVAINGIDGRTVNLFTGMQHGDCELHVEFMVPKGSNSGVYLMGRYEVQILDSWGVENPRHSDCGGIYQRWKDNKGYEGHPPRVNASLPPGQWQSFDITFRAPRFDSEGAKTGNARFIKVAHNGEVVHENVEVTGPTRAAAFEDEQPSGPLMLQGDHGPVAYRNIRIRPMPE